MRGFDADMVVMNPSFERDVVPGALDTLLDSLVVSDVFQFAALPRRVCPCPQNSELIAIGETTPHVASEQAARPAQVGARLLTSWN